MKKAQWLDGRVKRWTVRISLLGLFLLPSTLLAAETAFVELIPPKESAPWVGQRTVFALEVAVEGRFSGSTLFDLPQVRGAILMKPEERPVLSSRTMDEKEYAVQRHEFSLFCQQGNEVRVPEIQVRCGSIKTFGEPPSQHVLHVPSFRVMPRLPEGTGPGQVVVSTTRLEVKETWNPRPGKAKVGDAFRRTVTMRATDVPGMLLPRIPKPQVQGLAVYPSTPMVDDRTERGEFTGQRTESATYLCEAEGKVEIPAVQLLWWNPAKGAWERKTLPAVTLTVLPNPAYSPKEPNGPSPAGPETRGAYLWWAFALAAAGLGCWILVRRRIPDEEAEAFRKVIRACRNNDAAGAYNAVTRWRALAGLSPAVRSQEATEELFSAQRVIAGIESSWKGHNLERSLKAWRREARRRSPLLPGAGKLPELNPGG